MSESAKTPIFNLSEKRSIYSLSGVLFFRMFSLFLLLPVFSVLAMDLEGATPFLIGVAFGAYGLTQGLLQLPFGMWSDRAGRKLVIVIGLGLFIAQKIIKEHDGKVWAESEGKGKGSVFQFTVPVYDENQVPAYKEEAEEAKK